MQTFETRYLPAKSDNRQWLIFLHGYNNTYDELSSVYRYLQAKNPYLAIVAPEGNIKSVESPERKKWYKISGFDAEGKRHNLHTSASEIIEIYEATAEELYKTALDMNAFIDELQKKYNFTDADTFIAGFSQGAMLALWTSLIRRKSLAGCFMLSGLVAGAGLLQTKIVSRPHIYLLHGTDDTQVLFKCMDFTKNWLLQNHITAEVKAFDNLSHKVDNNELDFITSVLKTKKEA